MKEIANTSSKKNDVKTDNSVVRANMAESFQSRHSPADQVLHLQRTIGNQAVQRMVRSGALQAKLKIGQPGDRYEQEADRVAEQVMRMSNVQRQLEEEPVLIKPVITPLVHRQTEEEENLHTKELPGRSPEVMPFLSSKIQSLRGGGQPLPKATRSFFESRFSADFSQVRLHTDSHAVDTAKSINARAFTVDSDIAFGLGQYAPETDSGKKLLAHELTHVEQQSGKKIYRKENDDQQTDETKGDVPYEVNIIIELRDAIKSEKESLDDPDKRAKAERELLFLDDELILLEEPDYRKQIIEAYQENINDYSNILNENDNILSSEEETFLYLTELDPSDENLLGNSIYTDNISAFPKLTQKIILPLIKVPDGFEAWDISRRKAELSKGSIELQQNIYNYGYPVSYAKSLWLYDYQHIKRFPTKLFYLNKDNRPRYAEDFDQFIRPEEKNEYKNELTYFAYYYSAWTDYAIASYPATIKSYWLGMSFNFYYWIKAGRFKRIDIKALKSFKEQFPGGLTSEDDLLSLESKSNLLSIYFNRNLNIWDFFANIKSLGTFRASEALHDIIKQEQKNFRNYQGVADNRIRSLKPGERFDKAIKWTLDKGWAQKNLKEFIDNIDDLLVQILKERAKESVIKKVLSFVASLHPIGRIAAIAYQIYQTTKDVIESLDIVEKIYAIKNAVSDSRNAYTVAMTQRSAAQLAAVAVNILPDLVGKLLDIGVKKIKLRRRRLKESKNIIDVKNLNDDEFNAEVETALESPIYKFTDPKSKYDAEIILPNTHHWKRNKDGSWCRASDKCYPASLNPELTKELNEYVGKQPIPEPKTTEVEEEFKETGEKGIKTELPEGTDGGHRTFISTTPVVRSQPGRATGGKNLPYIQDQWFPEVRDPATGRGIKGTKDIRIAQIPGQIAEKMRNIGHFKNFQDFRETFWKLVVNDPILGNGWTEDNVDRMTNGLAPFVAPQQRVGGGSNAVYQLNHKLALKNEGDLYDLDNIEVVGPRIHGELGD